MLTYIVKITMQKHELGDSIISPVRKRKKLGHVILGLFSTYLVAYDPNIKFPNIIHIFQNEVLYALNKIRL
jgi:hypothetical protein